MRALATLFARELAAAWAGGGGAAAPAAFFLAASALAAFAVGAAPDVLAAAGPGVLVLSLTFAAMFGFEHLFQGDLETGVLDQLAVGPLSLEAIAAVKMLARAAATLAPLSLLAPVASIVLGAEPAAALVSAPVALIAAPGLVGAGAAPAALAAGRARGGLLIAILSPALLAPCVIFAAGALRFAVLGEPVASSLFLLAAASLVSLVIGSLGAAAALRMHLE